MSMTDSPTGRLSPQSLLQQRYLIVGLAGQGGMGAVYQAIDTRIAQRRVAVKEMSQAHLSEAERPGAEKRFRVEAALLGSLAHPSLPRVYEAFSEQGRLYLVMDFIEGKTLLQLLQQRGGHPLPLAQVLSYAQQLCDVLAYLHRQHSPIIFRDLKPANVMVTESGKIFLIDFGIARIFKAGQQQDTILLGSPGYAPPEQRGISQTNPRSDLYSLGATLHHCLTGQVPSIAGDGFFPLTRHYNAQVPEELDALIQRLVAFDEQQRPGTALEVQQALLHISQQAVAPTERMSSLYPAPYPIPPAYLKRSPVAPARPMGQVNSVAFGQMIPPSKPLQRSPHRPSTSLWSSSFTLLFGLLLALTIGGSSYAFNFITGSDHLVEGSLSLLLLLVLFGAVVVTRSLIAWSILGLTIATIIVACLAFLEQGALMEGIAGQQEGTITPIQASMLNQLLTIGLAGTALISLLWLARPFPWRDRLALLAIFGLPLACTLLQYPLEDSDVSKHMLLLIGLIALIQGVLLAAQTERIYHRKGTGG